MKGTGRGLALVLFSLLQRLSLSWASKANFLPFCYRKQSSTAKQLGYWGVESASGMSKMIFVDRDGTQSVETLDDCLALWS